MAFPGKDYGDGKPYAYVMFTRDKVERSVPAEFIYDFKPALIDTFNPRKQYFVFHSNNPKDTPHEALKRVSKIPLIEDDEESQDFGYYRATIAVMAGNKKDLETKRGSSRTRKVPAKLLTQKSFDCDEQLKKKSTLRKGARSTGKGDVSKENQGDKKHMESVKRQARAANLKDINTAKEEEDSENSCGSLPSSSEEEKSEEESQVSNDLKKSLQKNKRNEYVDMKNVFKRVRNVKARKRPRTKLESATDSSEEDALVSPGKYRRLEEDMKVVQAQNKRYSDFNLRLQEKLNHADDTVEELKQQLEDYKKQLKGCKCKPNSRIMKHDGVQDKTAAKTGHDDSIDDFSGFTDNSSFTEGSTSHRTEESTDGDSTTDAERSTPFDVENPTASLADESNLKLLDETEVSALCEAHVGKDGDSMYTKIVACRIFGKKVLRTHSITGRPDPKAKQKGLSPAGKPPLPQDKMKEVRALLIDKLRRENVQNPESDARAKQSVVNKYLRDRAKTLKPEEDDE